jgi:hypothetical protein
MAADGEFGSVQSDPDLSDPEEEQSPGEEQPSEEELPEIKVKPGRPTEVYEPMAMEEDQDKLLGAAVVKQLRGGARDVSERRVELDQKGLDELLEYIEGTEQKVKDIEDQYQQLLEQHLHEDDNRSVASNDSQMQFTHALSEMTKALTRDRSGGQTEKPHAIISKAIGDLRLEPLEEAEHGQMHAWEAWIKATKLKLQ